jgi:DNA-binding NarL/FixJ family response regulator
MRVFLVEDSPLLRTRLEAMLATIPGARAAGHADGAQEAIRRILEERPEAVVLDIHLKEGSGLDVLRAVHEAAPGIAVFVLTNYPEENYRRIAAQLGALGFFDKSSEFALLKDALAARGARA